MGLKIEKFSSEKKLRKKCSVIFWVTRGLKYTYLRSKIAGN